MIIKLERFDVICFEFQDGSLLSLGYDLLSKMKSQNSEIIPEDGFLLTIGERTSLKIRNDNKIPSIKGICSRTGMSLKGAKLHVEAYLKAQKLQPPAPYMD